MIVSCANHGDLYYKFTRPGDLISVHGLIILDPPNAPPPLPSDEFTCPFCFEWLSERFERIPS